VVLVAVLMAIFFLGQIDDLLKYQRQLTEFEKAYPTLAKIMIKPLKLFHESFMKTYTKTMKSLTKKFGKMRWFKFFVLFPCKCLRGTWVIFQKVLQPTCICSCTAYGKIKKIITDLGFFQWTTDKVLKKAGIRVDPKGDRKRALKAIKAAKQAKIDARQAKKQAKIVAKQEKQDEREAIKQARLEAKAAKKQARIDAKEAKKEARRAAREARNDAKLDALEDA
jgi:hypothetical protein